MGEKKTVGYSARCPEHTELVRYVVTGQNTVRLGRVLVPDLVPPEYRPDRLLGRTLTDCMHPARIHDQVSAALECVRETRRPVGFAFNSMLAGQSRVMTVSPLNQHEVVITVFDCKCEPRCIPAQVVELPAEAVEPHTERAGPDRRQHADRRKHRR